MRHQGMNLGRSTLFQHLVSVLRSVPLSEVLCWITLKIDSLVVSWSSCVSLLSGLVLVTDAVGAMGLPPGSHRLGQQVIEIQGLHAYVQGLFFY